MLHSFQKVLFLCQLISIHLISFIDKNTVFWKVNTVRRRHTVKGKQKLSEEDKYCQRKKMSDEPHFFV